MPVRHARLVGRAPQLGELTDLIGGAPRGMGAGCFVIGDPGMGISRLAAEAVAVGLERGLVVARGRATTSSQSQPFRALSEALLSLIRANPDCDGSQLGPYRAVLGTLLPDWRTTPAPAATPVLIAEGVLRLCAWFGRERGCLLVLEDLDSADPESLDALEYLLDNVAGLPIAVLATAHHGVVLELARAARQRGTAHIVALPPLDGVQTAELVCSYLDTDEHGVPAILLDTLRTVTDGSPLVIEELLQSMLDARRLVPDGAGWMLVEPAEQSLHLTLSQSIGQRLDRLSPTAVEVLETAAICGTRFPLSMLQSVHDLADHDLLALLGSAARLVVPDDDVEWYRFRHPAFREVILGRLTASSWRRRAAAAAEYVESLHPAPDGEWLALTAALLDRAGYAERAGQSLLAAGRRALAAGAAGSAVGLLQQALTLLGDEDTHLDAVDGLLAALAETGQGEQAFALVAGLDDRPIGRSGAERAGIHLRLAWIAHVSGRWRDGLTQVERARELIGRATPDADPATLRRLAAGADAAAAYLSFDSDLAEVDTAVAVGLAESAAALAEQWLDDPGMPTLACQARHLLGLAGRETDRARSDASFRRVCELADRYGLHIWRHYGLGGLAGNDWLGDGRVELMRKARDSAERSGAAVIALSSRAILALSDAMGGRLVEADTAAESVRREASALRLNGTARYASMVRTVAAAQRADRPAMLAAMAEMAGTGHDRGHERALAHGLGLVVCALLEEDHDLARRELAGLAQLRSEVRTTFFLSGDSGLAWLMRAVSADGRPTAAELDRVLDTAAGRMRWNRQFLLWARAVVVGAHDPVAADAAVASAREAATVFPLAGHLAGRLVAPHALADGWGDPIGWLRAAEGYFQQAGIVAVASTCRSLLRRSGESVYQRRAGTERVPERMRHAGITVREFEVLELLRLRLGNRDIASRLSISPRTVEKHVASGLAKLGANDRAEVTDNRWWHATSG